MVARDYELAYETILRFTSGASLPIQATLIGELSQRVVIRDAQGRPVRLSGYTQGRAEIRDASGRAIFRGRYYDSRTIRTLAGDEALTVVGQSWWTIGRMDLVKGLAPGTLSRWVGN